MNENKDTIINQMSIIWKNAQFFAIKTFIAQWVFIQSSKILWLKLRYGKNGLTCKN